MAIDLMENNTINHISLRYDFREVQNQEIEYGTDVVKVSKVDIDKFKRLVNEDAFLSYVVIVACIHINLFRFNNKSLVCTGLPTFDEADMLYEMQGEYGTENFKSFLKNMKHNMLESINQKIAKKPMNIIISMEGLNCTNNLYGDIVYDFTIDEQITYTVSYNTKRYNPETINLINQSFETVLVKCMEDPEISLEQLMELNPYEIRQIEEYNSKERDITDYICKRIFCNGLQSNIRYLTRIRFI